MSTAGTTYSKPSALMNMAAIAVIVASLAAVGAVTGIIPPAHSQKQEVMPVQDKVDGAVRPGSRAERTGTLQVAASCAQCGVIESIHAVEVKGQGTGVGAVAGGIAGALVGSQFGHGPGRAALGVLGAAGGAYAGHELEKNVRKTTSWRVSIRMDDGSVRTVS